MENVLEIKETNDSVEKSNTTTEGLEDANDSSLKYDTEDDINAISDAEEEIYQSNVNSDTDNSDLDSEDEIEKSEEKVVKTEKEKDPVKLEGFLQPDLSDNSDSDSDSDSEDEFSKLDNSRSLLTDIHKSLQSINYIEVEKLSRITRDENNRIIDSNHTTVPILSKYEKTKILGLRTKQINFGAKPFINVDEDVVDGYIIAEKELQEKKIPFIIKRPISNNRFEYWKLEDLEVV